MTRLFPLVLVCLSLSGCGASFPAALTIGQIVVNGTCSGAAKLCEAVDPTCGASACQISHEVCAVLAPNASVQISCDPAPDAGQ